MKWIVLTFFLLFLTISDLKAQCFGYLIVERYDTQSGIRTFWISNVIDLEYPYESLKQRLNYLFPGWVKADLNLIKEGLTDGIKFCGPAGLENATESRAGVSLFLTIAKGEDVKIKYFNF